MKNQPISENCLISTASPSVNLPHNLLLVEMLERISDGFFALDHEWGITYINSQFENMFGIRRECFLNQNLWECYPQLKGTVYDDSFRRALHDGVTVKFERHSEKYNCWFEISAHPSQTGLSVFFRDITTRKKMEEDLRLSNERFRLAAKTDAIYDWDLLTNQLHWGEGLQTLFGCTPLELQIEQWIAALHPDENSVLVADLEKALANPGVDRWDKEYRIWHRDGSLCYASECGHIIRDSNGRAVRMVGVMKNITQRKNLELELERQRRWTTTAVIKAQERERANIGRELHDNVNQILTTVKLYQEVVLSGTGDHEELVRKSMELLQLAIDENRRLSKQLSVTTLEKTTVRDTVRELLDNFAAAQKFEICFQETAVEEYEASDELHLALYRILQEHLTNVTKYAAARRVQVGLAQGIHDIVLTVADDGCGFDPTQKRSGIGIANMNMRAEHLGGSLTICSSPGKGCKLVARFPVCSL